MKLIIRTIDRETHRLDISGHRLSQYTSIPQYVEHLCPNEDDGYHAFSGFGLRCGVDDERIQGVPNSAIIIRHNSSGDRYYRLLTEMENDEYVTYCLRTASSSWRDGEQVDPMPVIQGTDPALSEDNIDCSSFYGDVVFDETANIAGMPYYSSQGRRYIGNNPIPSAEPVIGNNGELLGVSVGAEAEDVVATPHYRTGFRPVAPNLWYREVSDSFIVAPHSQTWGTPPIRASLDSEFVAPSAVEQLSISSTDTAENYSQALARATDRVSAREPAFDHAGFNQALVEARRRMDVSLTAWGTAPIVGRTESFTCLDEVADVPEPVREGECTCHLGHPPCNFCTEDWREDGVPDEDTEELIREQHSCGSW